jgi:hypothetical protein
VAEAGTSSAKENINCVLSCANAALRGPAPAKRFMTLRGMATAVRLLSDCATRLLDKPKVQSKVTCALAPKSLAGSPQLPLSAQNPTTEDSCHLSFAQKRMADVFISASCKYGMSCMLNTASVALCHLAQTSLSSSSHHVTRACYKNNCAGKLLRTTSVSPTSLASKKMHALDTHTVD